MSQEVPKDQDLIQNPENENEQFEFETEVIEIDKSKPLSDDDDDDDDDEDFQDDDARDQYPRIDDYEALNSPDLGDEFIGEGDDMYGPYGGEGDDDDMMGGKVGDTEAHDGDAYDDSIINMATMTLKNHTDSVFSITIDQSSQLLVAGSADDTASLIDLTTSKLLYKFDQDFDDSIIKVEFSPLYNTTTKYLAIACMSGLVRFYKLTDLIEFKNTINNSSQTNTESIPTLQHILEFNQENDLDTFTWHPTREIITIGCSDGQIWWYDLTTEQTAVTFGHSSGITSLYFNQTGTKLFSSSLDGQVIINPIVLDLEPQEQKNQQIKHNKVDDSEPVIAMTIHPATNLLVVGTGSGSICSVSTLDKVFGGVKSATAHKDSIEHIKFYQINPTTLYLFSASIDGIVRAFNYTDSLQPRFTIELQYAITSLQFHPIAQLLFLASHDGIVRIHDATDGKHLLDITGHQDAILDMIITPTHLYTSSDDKTVRQFDLTQLLPPEALKPPQTMLPAVTAGRPGAQVGGKPGLNVVGGNIQRRPVVKPGKPTPTPPQ